jgi:hypothetical protein
MERRKVQLNYDEITLLRELTTACIAGAGLLLAFSTLPAGAQATATAAAATAFWTAARFASSQGLEPWIQRCASYVRKCF